MISTQGTADDIIADFKTNKFVIADEYMGYGSVTVVLTDLNFWTKFATELQQWISNCTPTADMFGFTIDFKNQEDLLLFVLRWK